MSPGAWFLVGVGTTLWTALILTIWLYVYIQCERIVDEG